MNHYLTLITFFFLLHVPVWSQPVEEPLSEELQFSCIFWEGKPSEDLYYRDGETFHLLKFRTAKRSRSFDLNRSEFFELYRKAVAPVEGMPPYDLLSRSRIPTTEQVLFVVIPLERDGRIQYRIISMDDSVQAFPPGTFRFVNFSSEDLLIKCGEEIEKVLARNMCVIRPDDATDARFVPFHIGNSQGKELYGTRIYGQPSGRELIFIIPPAKEGGIPRLKFISQLMALTAPDPNTFGQ